ncbi:peroxisome biogenesis factor 1 [Trichogramma pretiosum]|uniref:peroxisome biogenesis factor 1 n=1 Tax=Trichogramma pretiosum TaxID=7493 RepID=UPI0006C94D4F|nr:peroxisome biogenesis factor 1 [Trichogramma pretiosum]XP_023319087.1 peroxisome biogenesis factor 1 [Trichogramma pretiosum]
MQNERFEVQFVRVNTCFVYLPEHWLRKLSSRANSSLIRLRHNERDYYLSWYARPSPDQSRLCLGATFARSLGIKEADEVFVTIVNEQPPALTSLLCAPASDNDREIVELQSEIIQMNLLDQVRVVAVDQPIVAWVSKFLSVKLVVKSMNPQFKYGRLEENTEIHIGDASAPQSKTLKEEKSHQRDVLDVIRAENSNTSFGEIRRVLPLNRKETAAVILPPCRVYTHGGGKVTLARLRKIGEDQHDAKSSKIKFNFRRSSAAEAKETIVEVHPLDENLDSSYKEFPRHPCVYVGPDLMRSASLRLNAKVVLEELTDADRADVSRCTSIELAPCSSNSNNEAIVSERRFRDWLRRVAATQRGGGRVLINSGSLVSLDDDANEASLCSVKLKPDGCAYGFFDASDAETVQVRVRDGVDVDAYRPPGLEREEEEEDDTTMTIEREESNGNVALEVMKDLLDECSILLKLSLSLMRHQRSSSNVVAADNALIIGAPGSGKTTCCRLLAARFRAGPWHCHARHLDCRRLKGKKAELVQKLLGAELARACYLQPAILFLDDLDSITSVQNQGNEEEITPDSTNAAKITEIIVTQTRELQLAGHSVALVATCSDLAKLGKKLRDARGIHFFRAHLTIGSLEKSERIKILRSCLEDRLSVSSDIDWDSYANKTEGWVIQDLAVLADKAAYAAWKRHVSEKRLRRNVTATTTTTALTLSAEDLDATLARSQPASLRGVQLYRGSGHRWRDIGGLAHVKAGLIEILHWPLRYPAVFKRAPVKLQSGILLYGMPGTGKTMLAGAIAKECGLNLISVKGPELLSKYIGASEEAVRNVFEKAQRAKPCVLFFDEFDSLAPRRGHDSTGVTDRVVNQLLTHLDGIEGREGVAVVAASSRPDLLDPALLRPGRLDKSLLCPLPDVTERMEILSALCETHDIDTEQLDLRALAAAAEDFTGADLNAVVAQAKLCAIEASLESNELNVFVVGQEELVKSMLATKPSLLASEKQKYQRIYAKFAKNESYTAAGMRHQKATLA